MSGFTKLVPEIIQSSIWNEPSDIRIVWITMLAVKDETGYVQGDARTIARLANVPQDAAVTALELFQKPDPFSHTPNDDGRRIAPSAGGWIVLNHEKYRVRDHRAEHAEYVRNWRKSRDVTKCESQVSHPSASASVSESEDKSLREGEEQRPAWWNELKKNSQFEHLTYEDAVILFRGRNLDPEATIKELLPVLRTAPWEKVRQYGEGIWFGWQLDDVNKRNHKGSISCREQERLHGRL